MEPVLKIEESFTTKTKTAILKTLAYFDIFDYPITLTEIKKFSELEVNNDHVNIALNNLVSSGTVFKLEEYYTLRDDFSLVFKREKGNYKARKTFPKATAIGRFLYKFPFVRGIAISGSLSKNFLDNNGDVDFFIITKANRLWVARTLMHLFKKLTYITGSQHLYCMNYYVDETSLKITDENIYIATEIKTLKPIAGPVTVELFFRQNNWVNSWLPNFPNPTEQKIGNEPWVKKCFEWILGGKAGEKLDNFLFKITTSRWNKKEKRGKKNIKGRTMNLLTGKHYAKSNPDFYQEKIMDLYHRKIAMLKNQRPEFF